MNNRSFRSAIVFSLILFVVVAITSILTFALAILLLRSGVIDRDSRPIVAMLPVMAGIIVGTTTALTMIRRPIRAIKEISRATQAVAGGDFSVQLTTDSTMEELQEMAQNFNIMTRELANTEILRNDFVANVSHEFKTPLAAIEGYVTLLQQKNLSEEKRMEYTAHVLHNARRLSTLTGNILLLSKLENQEMEISKETFCLDEQLREIILLFEEQWNAKELELEVELDAVDYTGNEELLAQVWQNILSNAVKFTPERGKIWVSLRRRDDSVRVAIADSGIGMSEEVRHRVFEKFYQGDSSRTSSGNGLGLTLAKRIVDLHGGTITVEAKENVGTTFTVELKTAPNDK